MSRTPAKETSFSTEKLKRKINSETNKLRQQRRDNLFNKQRSNLESSANSSSDFLSLADDSSNQEMVAVSIAAPVHQVISIDYQPDGSQKLVRKLVQRKKSDKASKSPPEMDITSDPTEEYTQFYQDLESRYSAFRTATSKQNAVRLAELFNTPQSRATISGCSTRFRILAVKQSELAKYLREGAVNFSANVDDYPAYSTSASKLVNDIIVLIHEVLNTLINFSFNNTDANQVELIENLASAMLCFHHNQITTLDEQRRYLVKFIEFCWNSRTLELSQVNLYCNLFEGIDRFIGLLKENRKDDIWRYLTSNRFLKLLKQHTKFACQLIRTNRMNESMVNSDWPGSNSTRSAVGDSEMSIDSQTSKLPTPYQANRNLPPAVREYISDLFCLTLAQSTRLELDGYEFPDDLYQLISHQKELLAYELGEDQFAYFVQTLNNYFEPSYPDSVLEFLFPLQFIEDGCLRIKAKVNLIEHPKSEADKFDSAMHARMIGILVGLFSNLTSMDKYCQLLVNLNFTDQLTSLIAIGKINSNLNLLFYTLTVIKNIISIQTCNENLSRFQQSNVFGIDVFEKIFSSILVRELIDAFASMNGDCKQELSAILSELFRYAKPAVIGKFMNPKFFQLLNDLMEMNDANLAMIALRVLSLFVRPDESNTERLVLVLNHIDTAGLIDSLEMLSYSPNSQINRLASNLVEKYYDLSELKENLSPF